VPYSLASGIGFNILAVNQRETADKFVRNCGILVGVTQEAMAAEQEWKERAKSIQAMIEQIGQAPVLPGVPAP
jgi:Zn-dependent oligopeptidase